MTTLPDLSLFRSTLIGAPPGEHSGPVEPSPRPTAAPCSPAGSPSPPRGARRVRRRRRPAPRPVPRRPLHRPAPPRPGARCASPEASACGAPPVTTTASTPPHSSTTHASPLRRERSPLPVGCRRRGCVRFATDGGTGLRLRAGGHSYGGWSAGDGLVADLSGMADVTVDRDARTARIGAGRTARRRLRDARGGGVAVGAGSCPTVGLSGLTLGGGVWCARPVLRPDVRPGRDGGRRPADGRARTVGTDSSGDDADLFWACAAAGAASRPSRRGR